MTKKEILFADDDADDRLLFEQIFAQLKFEDFVLTQFKNGQEVIDRLNAITTSGQNLPCLIILDQNMPNVNGREALRFVKNNKHLAAIPVVIYSTSIFGKFSEECKNAGATLIIEKPGMYKEYQEMITKIVRLVDY